MRVLVNGLTDLVINFEEDELKCLSETEKDDLISAAVKEIVTEQVSWMEIWNLKHKMAKTVTLCFIFLGSFYALINIIKIDNL